MSSSRRLADAITKGSSSHNAAATKVERILWVEPYTWKERVTEFCEETDPEGHFESASSSGHKDYQDRLRCIALRKDGRSKGDISSAIGRSIKFVQTWWEKEPREVPKPAGVHQHLAPEFWRDLQIIRAYGRGMGIYDKLVMTTDWCQNKGTTPGFKDGGGSRLWYDKEGRMKDNSKQYGRDGLQAGTSQELDVLVQKLLVERGIDDRLLRRPSLLWYPDGSSMAIPHRHECWTALLSFGAPRILTIDEQPVLLRDGDLIVFGTQRHGVPRMCEEGGTFQEYGGRISIVFFFMPSGLQASGAEPWKAISVEPDVALSRTGMHMQQDATVSGTTQRKLLAAGPAVAQVRQLVELGFQADQAIAALQATGFDVARAAEALFNGCGSALLTVDDGDEANEATKLRRRLADISAKRSCTAPDDADTTWEEQAILERLQEMEGYSCATSSSSSISLLQAQFKQFDEMLDAEDAQAWDGRGDLMARADRREHLQFDQQDPVVLYSIGCGRLHERALFDLLTMHDVHVLYDLRARPGHGSRLSHSSLATACKVRGLSFKQVALGRESAYGIIKHLREDEGRNILAELVWHAKRKCTAFLGSEEDWHCDNRIAIAASLVGARHVVHHIAADGKLHQHPDSVELPQSLLLQESRLRSLERQRRDGQLMLAEKGAPSRSSEAVALRLSQPSLEIDAAAEVRSARDQAELQRIQQRLARLYCESELQGQGGQGTKVVNAGKWVVEGALHLESRKEEAQQALLESKSNDTKEPLLVDCLMCGVALPWSELQLQDGRCTACAVLTSHRRDETGSKYLDDEVVGANSCGDLASNKLADCAVQQNPRSGRWQRRHRIARNAA